MDFWLMVLLIVVAIVLGLSIVFSRMARDFKKTIDDDERKGFS